MEVFPAPTWVTSSSVLARHIWLVLQKNKQREKASGERERAGKYHGRKLSQRGGVARVSIPPPSPVHSADSAEEVALSQTFEDTSDVRSGQHCRLEQTAGWGPQSFTFREREWSRAGAGAWLEGTEACSPR